MKIRISTDAAQWFAEEMEAKAPDSIRFFARYGGSSPLHEGFSLGVTKEEPDEVAVETIVDGVRYYVETRDEWYFDQHDLYVELHPELKEPHYEYRKLS